MKKQNRLMPARKAKKWSSVAKEPTSGAAKSRREPTKKELEDAVYQLEVSITASPREARQKYLSNLDVVPPPDVLKKKRPSAAKPQLSYAQARSLRSKRMVEFAEFVVTFILIAGILAGLYKWWQMPH